MNKDFYVYILFDGFGAPRYVGKGHGNRIDQHLVKFDPKNWMKMEAIEHALILHDDLPRVKIREGLTEAEAFETEIALIAVIGRYPNGPLANLTDGGEGPVGRKFSELSRQRMSVAHRGKKLSREQVEKTAAKLRGRKLGPRKSPHWSLGKKATPEHKKNMSEAQKRRWRNMDVQQREHLLKNLGNTTPETRAKLSAAHKGKPKSKEHCLKISEGRQRGARLRRYEMFRIYYRWNDEASQVFDSAADKAVWG